MTRWSDQWLIVLIIIYICFMIFVKSFWNISFLIWVHDIFITEKSELILNRLIRKNMIRKNIIFVRSEIKTRLRFCEKIVMLLEKLYLPLERSYIFPNIRLTWNSLNRLITASRSRCILDLFSPKLVPQNDSYLDRELQNLGQSEERSSKTET